jgi:hypothetical protein
MRGPENAPPLLALQASVDKLPPEAPEAAPERTDGVARGSWIRALTGGDHYGPDRPTTRSGIAVEPTRPVIRIATISGTLALMGQ